MDGVHRRRRTRNGMPPRVTSLDLPLSEERTSAALRPILAAVVLLVGGLGGVTFAARPVLDRVGSGAGEDPA
jgi:hypothetical protein